MNYLTKDDVLDLHTFAVERYGGLLGIKSQDRLQAVVTAPSQAMFGVELYPDLCSKGAILVYLIVKNHPFVSANETTALLALLRLLALNGATLRHELDPAELARLFQALNHAEMNREHLEGWLRERIVGPGEAP